MQASLFQICIRGISFSYKIEISTFKIEMSVFQLQIREGHPISNANSSIFSTQIDLSQFYLYI